MYTCVNIWRTGLINKTLNYACFSCVDTVMARELKRHPREKFNRFSDVVLVDGLVDGVSCSSTVTIWNTYIQHMYVPIEVEFNYQLDSIF